jgi:hypothetical protein
VRVLNALGTKWVKGPARLVWFVILKPYFAEWGKKAGILLCSPPLALISRPNHGPLDGPEHAGVCPGDAGPAGAHTGHGRPDGDHCRFGDARRQAEPGCRCAEP